MAQNKADTQVSPYISAILDTLPQARLACALVAVMLSYATLRRAAPGEATAGLTYVVVAGPSEKDGKWAFSLGEGVVKKLALIWENSKFSRTIFVLPFAYVGMFLAARGLPAPAQFLWITLAMVSARTLAMSLNRVIDRELDARHPVERFRPVPAGFLSVGEVYIVSLVCLIVFLVSAWQLNELTLKLAPVALVLLVGYHYTKYWTWACNFGVGLTQACGPVGAWIGVTGSVSWEAVILGLVVFFWGSGFDLMQTCRDVDFDRAQDTHSFAVRFGIAASLLWSSIMHVIAFALLAALGMMLGLSWLYWAGIALGGGILLYEHLIVRPTDLSRINFAWADLNGYFSITVMAFTFGALFI